MIASPNGSRTMWAPSPTPEPPKDELAATLTDLAFGIARDAQTLLKQQLQMLSAEFDEDLAHSKASVQYFSLGIVLLTVGGLALMACLVHLMIWAFPTLTMWGAEAMVGGVCLAVGGAFIFAGQRLFSSFNPLPDKTFKALTENLSWIANPRK